MLIIFCTAAGDIISESKNTDYGDALTNVDEGEYTLKVLNKLY